MLARVISAALKGIEAHLLEIEVDISHRAMPSIIMVGLPDAAVKESRDRVKTALINAGYPFPAQSRLTINLAPADTKKEGPAYDLPIALGILAANKIINAEKLSEYAVIGELALDSRLRPVKGILSMALTCRKKKLKGLILPQENAEEAAVVDNIEIIPVKNLSEAAGFINHKLTINPLRINPYTMFEKGIDSYEVDFADVKGQEHVKRALTVAASGMHNLLMIGPPGAGKTMLAKRLPTIMPPLTHEESLETTRLHSIAGLLPLATALITNRPFRIVHHTVSEPHLVGGGTYARPGEISLANHGVLFLDELPEFHRNLLESLRQPIEEGNITIGRASASYFYPARFMLVAAMNPCPDGNFGDPKRECHCTPYQIQRYRSKVSGPLLDRIDIHIEVPSIAYKDIASSAEGTSSAEMKTQVMKARQIQTERFKNEKIFTNSQMNTRQIKKYCKIDEACENLLKQAFDELGLSARAHSRILKLGRTIADLEGSTNIQVHHISEAIQYRSLDRAILY